MPRGRGRSRGRGRGRGRGRSSRGRGQSGARGGRGRGRGRGRGQGTVGTSQSQENIPHSRIKREICDPDEIESGPSGTSSEAPKKIQSDGKGKAAEAKPKPPECPAVPGILYEDEPSKSCPLCAKQLMWYNIMKDSEMLLCPNPKCVYPIDDDEEHPYEIRERDHGKNPLATCIISNVENESEEHFEQELNEFILSKGANDAMSVLAAVQEHMEKNLTSKLFSDMFVPSEPNEMGSLQDLANPD